MQISKISIKKISKAVRNSSRIEGYKETKNKRIKSEIKKLANALCQ